MEKKDSLQCMWMWLCEGNLKVRVSKKRVLKLPTINLWRSKFFTMLDEGREGLKSEKIHWGVDGEDKGGVGSYKIIAIFFSNPLLACENSHPSSLLA